VTADLIIARIVDGIEVDVVIEHFTVLSADHFNIICKDMR